MDRSRIKSGMTEEESNFRTAIEMGYKSTADKIRPARLLVKPSNAKIKTKLIRASCLGASQNPYSKRGRYMKGSFSLARGSRRSLGCSPKK